MYTRDVRGAATRALMMILYAQRRVSLNAQPVRLFNRFTA